MKQISSAGRDQGNRARLTGAFANDRGSVSGRPGLTLEARPLMGSA
jgi:hypothetical protein